jgi:transketolase
MALEKVQETYGERFINAGVSEQNMTSLAAGLAHEGFIPWIYSIAPFAILRPYEQIRNDVCLHNRPVKIVGNGGGYGYGIMGATHHTLEDIAIMRVLPNMKVYVPLVASDVEEAVNLIAANRSPSYLRLNLAAKIEPQLQSFRQWRKIKDGTKGVIIGTGPVIGNALGVEDKDVVDGCEVWSVGIFPIDALPMELTSSIRAKKRVITMEEHYGQCGLNETVAQLLLKTVDCSITYKTLFARGYPSGNYGSQRWHQGESGLAGDSLVKQLKDFLNG